MSATIREIVDAALTVVGEVTGPGVQLYEEDRMFQDAVRAFNMMFKKYPWEQYRDWFTVTLDGSAGVPSESPFEQVKDFEDFIAVYRDKESARLPIAPTRLNPSTLTGTRVLFWTSLPTTHPNYKRKKLRFYPSQATNTLNILAKVYPLVPPAAQFEWGQELFLDKDMLVYATAYMTLSGDDLNAGAADVVRNLMEMKFKDVMHALAGHPIPIAYDTSIPSYYQELP